MISEGIIVPARQGKAFRLSEAHHVKLINTFGEQVVDTWAFNAENMSEFMSMEHCRSCLASLIPAIGDKLYSNKRRPILTIVEDTSPGVHDMLLSVCDVERYRLLGHEGFHDNCVNNLKVALAELELTTTVIPSPWNVFENVVISEEGGLEIHPATVKAGQHLILRAEMDVIVVFSVCPMDIAPTNGRDGVTKEVQYQIF